MPKTLYCPNLTSTPPWPASITMVYNAFGEEVALTANIIIIATKQIVTPKKIKTAFLLTIKNKFFIMYFINKTNFLSLIPKHLAQNIENTYF